MTRVTYSPAAITDIDGIWGLYCRDMGLDRADSYTDEIRDACNDLSVGVKHGRIVDVRNGYLKYAVGKHIVFFVRVGDGVAVIRVLHQQMDTERHL